MLLDRAYGENAASQKSAAAYGRKGNSEAFYIFLAPRSILSTATNKRVNWLDE